MNIDRFFEAHPVVEFIVAMTIIFGAVGLFLFWFLTAAKII